MRNRWLINLVLLVLALFLAAQIRNEVSRPSVISTLTDLRSSELVRIEIAREGEPRIRLTQSPQGWRIEAPMQLDANAEQVGKLLAIVDTPVHRSFPQEAAALDELGLKPIAIKLFLNDRELDFGGIDPLGQFRYVASDGLIHLIDDRFYHLLIAPALDYVARNPVPSGFNPVFGRIAGVPLAPETLDKLQDMRAERIEPLSEAMSGSAVELKTADGTVLAFQVSEDRRRWARSDLHLLYVLTVAPELMEDPSAVDPTPPPAQPALADPESPTIEASPLGTESPAPPMHPATEDPFQEPTPDESSYPPAPALEHLAPGRLNTNTEPSTPEQDSPGAPPVVHLAPDMREDETPAKPKAASRRKSGKVTPYGFGQDPFSPDPPAHLDLNLTPDLR